MLVPLASPESSPAMSRGQPTSKQRRCQALFRWLVGPTDSGSRLAAPLGALHRVHLAVLGWWNFSVKENEFKNWFKKLVKCISPVILLQKWWNKFCCASCHQIYMIKILHVIFEILFCRALINSWYCWYLVKCVVNPICIKKIWFQVCYSSYVMYFLGKICVMHVL